jgi:hypothetical protein
MESPVFQSSLGRLAGTFRQDQNMFGYIVLAEVIKVHDKHNTVDVKLIRNNNRVVGSANNEGRFACRVLSSNSGYDSANQISYGVQEPLMKGQTVALTFLDGLKDEPVIIGTMHNVDNLNNILPSSYPLDPINSFKDLKDSRKYLRVFPLQDYFKIDGIGNLEFAMHSKSFLSWSEDIDDDTTDFEDLSEKSKTMPNSTLQLPTNFQDESGNGYKFYTNPKNFLLVFRDNIDDSLSTRTKIFVDMTKDKGSLRLSRDNNDNTLSYIQMSSNGAIKIKRQLDSNKRDESSNFTEFSIDETGKVIVSNSKGATFTIDGDSINFTGNVLVNGKEVLTKTE